MTRFSFLAAFAAVVVSISLVCHAPAQQGGTAQHQPNMTATAPPAAAPRAAMPIGLVDINRVFRSLSRFKAAQEQVLADMQQFDAWVKSEKEGLQNLARRMQEFKPGSPEFKEVEKEGVKREFNLKIEIELKQKELMQRDSVIHLAAYREVQQEVQSIAAERGFALVLRYNGAEASGENRDQVLMEVNKQVVFFSRELDITDDVIARLERRANFGQSADTRATVPMRPAANQPPTRR